MFVLEAESWELGLEKKFKILFLFSPSLDRIKLSNSQVPPFLIFPVLSFAPVHCPVRTADAVQCGTGSSRPCGLGCPCVRLCFPTMSTAEILP